MKPVIYQIVVRYFGNMNTTNQQDGTIEGKFVSGKETMLRINFDNRGQMNLSLQ